MSYHFFSLPLGSCFSPPPQTYGNWIHTLLILIPVVRIVFLPGDTILDLNSDSSESKPPSDFQAFFSYTGFYEHLLQEKNVDLMTTDS